MEKCGFFDSKLIDDEFDRVYAADTFAAYFASFIGNGIFNNKETEIIQVKENSPRSMSVIVTPGQAWINGYWYKNTEDLLLNLSIADGYRDRIDSVVLRWDKNQRSMYCLVLEGEVASFPVAPQPVRNGEYYDLLLATISIKAGTINISQMLITDTRMNNEVCGFVTSIVDQVNTTTLFEQFNDFYNNFVTVEAANFIEWSLTQREEFEEWFQGVKDILDEKVVTNLLNMIEKVRLNIAPDFDAATNYSIGQMCNYDGFLYKCINPHYGPWNANNFEKTSLAKNLEGISAIIDEHMEELVNDVEGLKVKTTSQEELLSEHTSTLSNHGGRIANVEAKSTENSSNISSLVSTTNTLNSNKMDKSNPSGTGSLSINRKLSSSTGANSVAIGDNVEASGYCSIAIGGASKATANYAYAEGYNNSATGGWSHSEGWGTQATGEISHSEGRETLAEGADSHAEGFGTKAYTLASHTEGYNTRVLKGIYDTGAYAHAEGNNCYTTGEAAHAEGISTSALQAGSHAEGHSTSASGIYSHAEGDGAKAMGEKSHAEGGSTASGSFSHAEGNSVASNYYSHSMGYNNVNMEGIGTWDNPQGKAFVIGNGRPSYKSNAFSVMFNGVTKCASTFTSNTTADYAELFEWSDGNKNEEDRVGFFVTLENDKIRIANQDDEYILGVISGEPFVLGNGDCDSWGGMFLRDEFNRIIMETELDEEGKERQVPKLNPEYDEDREYISRLDRKEWAPVGMLGVLAVRQDGSLKVNGYATVNSEGIATSSKSLNNKSYRVIRVKSKNVAEIIVR